MSTVLSQFLAQIGSDLTDYKQFDVAMRDTIIDGYGDEELKDLSDRLNLGYNGKDFRAFLKQAAREIDNQQQFQNTTQLQQQQGVDEYPEDERLRRKHRFEKFKSEGKASDEDK